MEYMYNTRFGWVLGGVYTALGGTKHSSQTVKLHAIRVQQNQKLVDGASSTAEMGPTVEGRLGQEEAVATYKRTERGGHYEIALPLTGIHASERT